MKKKIYILVLIISIFLAGTALLVLFIKTRPDMPSRLIGDWELDRAMTIEYNKDNNPYWRQKNTDHVMNSKYHVVCRISPKTIAFQRNGEGTETPFKIKRTSPNETIIMIPPWKLKGKKYRSSVILESDDGNDDILKIKTILDIEKDDSVSYHIYKRLK